MSLSGTTSQSISVQSMSLFPTPHVKPVVARTGLIVVRTAIRYPVAQTVRDMSRKEMIAIDSNCIDMTALSVS